MEPRVRASPTGLAHEEKYDGAGTSAKIITSTITAPVICTNKKPQPSCKSRGLLLHKYELKVRL